MSEQYWTVTVSLTAEEYAQLVAHADAAGQPVSVYATRVLADHKPKKTPAAKTTGK